MEPEPTRPSDLDGDDPAACEWRDRIHDLKNPLSAILANCQYLIAHGTLTGESREVVGDIANSAKALRDLLDGRQNATGGKSGPGRAKK